MDVKPAEYIEFTKNLVLIKLDLPLEGFRDFISVWLYRGKYDFLVDVGPSSTAPRLIRTLNALGVDTLDYILLTHIHLDHAGGIGEIAHRFPDVPVVCHRSAVPHLVDPSRLWQATRSLLGPVAVAYGPIRPVDASRLVAPAHLETASIQPLITPGHAPHHISYRIDACLFVGEAGGVCLSAGKQIRYLRPATPPKLFFDQALESVDHLIDSNPRDMCYSHFGMVKNGREMLELHRSQLLLWRDVTAGFADAPDADGLSAAMQVLMRSDPLLKAFSLLPPDIQHREAGFLRNSIKGFMGCHGAAR